MEELKFSQVRSGFGLNRKKVNDMAVLSSEDIFGKFMPKVVEGAELLDAVCPVSKFTGKRCNPLSLLGMLTGAKVDVLNSILQELPVVTSDSRLTDEDRINFIVERCSTGTPAEDALMAERLMADIDALGLRHSSVEDSIKDPGTINFENTETPKSE